MSLRTGSRRHAIPLVVVACIFGSVGSYLLFSSMAATPTASVEVDQGTLVAPATKFTDSTASGGSAIKFGDGVTTPVDNVLLSTNFNSLTVANPMSAADYRNAMGDQTLTVDPATNLKRTSIIDEGGTHGRFIRQTLPASKGDGSDLTLVLGGAGGLVTMPKLSQTVNEATMQYDVRFANNPDGTSFEWKGGGKLPGLGGVMTGVTPGVAAGCSNPTDTRAWSARGMWHGPPAYNVTTTGKGNEWIGYMYTYRKANGACGEDVKTIKGFDTNQWHTIKQYHKLNTVTNGVPNADGIHRMWVDGVQVINNTAYLYRNSTSVPLNYLYWSIFRGGSCANFDSTCMGKWESTREGRIDIDNLLITAPSN